jgi:hypothetical protein
MISIPIISRLTANMIVNSIIPEIGCANTMDEIAKDNMPTPIRKALDHCEMFLFVIPCRILAIPRRNSPTDNKATKEIAAIRGKMITANPNPMVITPTIMLPMREDFAVCRKLPAATLSNPSTSNVSESRKIKVVMPNPGSAIITRDKTIAIAPSIICEFLIALDELESLCLPFMFCYQYGCI